MAVNFSNHYVILLGLPPRGDPTQGFVLPNAAGGAPAFLFQEFDVATSGRKIDPATSVPVLDVAFNNAMVNRAFIKCLTVQEMVSIITTQTTALEKYRDLFSLPLPIRITYQGADYQILSFESLQGCANIVKYFIVQPWQPPRPQRITLKDFGEIALWEAPVAVVPANTPAPSVVSVTIQRDSYMDTSGSIRYKGVYAKGRPIPDDSDSLKLGASLAGMQNFPWPMNLQNYVVCLDPAWWAHLAEFVVTSQNTLETPAEAFAASVRLALETFMALERSAELSAEKRTAKDDPHNVALFRPIHSVIDDTVAIAHQLAVNVRSKAPLQMIHELVQVLRNFIFRLLGRKKIAVEKPSSENLICPPWYYRMKNPQGASPAKRGPDGEVIE